MAVITMEPTLKDLTTALVQAWSAETSCWGADWPADNPARGQCVVSSLVMQDYLGGDLLRLAVRGEGIHENHCCNILADGTVIDVTRSQYHVPITMTDHPKKLHSYGSQREWRLSDNETRTQYELLKSRMAQHLKAL